MAATMTGTNSRVTIEWRSACKLLLLAGAMLSVLFADALAQESGVKSEDKPKAADGKGGAAASQPAKPKRIRMKYNVGEIVIELDWEKAPISCENFAQYTKDGFFDGTVIHRVVPGFVIQGGGYDKDYNLKKTRDPIKNEWKNGLKNARGTLSMARTQAPDSASSQFFVNLKDNTNLDMPISGGAAYAVFGKVVEGMDVVDKIAAMTCRPNPKVGGMPSPEPAVVCEKAVGE